MEIKVVNKNRALGELWNPYQNAWRIDGESGQEILQTSQNISLNVKKNTIIYLRHSTQLVPSATYIYATKNC